LREHSSPRSASCGIVEGNRRRLRRAVGSAQHGATLSARRRDGRAGAADRTAVVGAGPVVGADALSGHGREQCGGRAATARRRRLPGERADGAARGRVRPPGAAWRTSRPCPASIAASEWNGSSCVQSGPTLANTSRNEIKDLIFSIRPPLLRFSGLKPLPRSRLRCRFRVELAGARRKKKPGLFGSPSVAPLLCVETVTSVPPPLSLQSGVGRRQTKEKT
jgi:hypothetical protein